MKYLDQLFRTNNCYAKAYKMMSELEAEEMEKAKNAKRDLHPVMMYIKTTKDIDLRKYNAPKVNEVAVVFTNSDGEPPHERAIRIHLRDETFKTREVSTLSPHCDALVYPLLFPNGDLGWDCSMKRTTGKGLTQLDYYSHRLSIRNDFNPLLNAGKLTQQFIVDAYVKIEGNRLKWVKENQKKVKKGTL
jgi:hypothetical protein